MHLPRIQFVEFNDSAWAPASLRDMLVENLSRTLAWGRVLQGLVEPFEGFVEAAGAREILDIASGAGGPVRILVDEILRAGRTPPRFVLTDLHPQPEAWAAAESAFPGTITFEPAPVDATRIPEDLARGRARLIVNALHHLSPQLAARIFDDAVRSGSAIFVSEVFERDPLGIVPLVPSGFAALAVNPILTRHDRLAKALLTWASPISLAASAWDSLVSAMRVYSRGELEAMVAPSGDAFTWTYGNYAYPFGGRGYYFHGVPRP